MLRAIILRAVTRNSEGKQDEKKRKNFIVIIQRGAAKSFRESFHSPEITDSFSASLCSSELRNRRSRSGYLAITVPVLVLIYGVSNQYKLSCKKYRTTTAMDSIVKVTYGRDCRCSQNSLHYPEVDHNLDCYESISTACTAFVLACVFSQ